MYDREWDMKQYEKEFKAEESKNDQEEFIGYDDWFKKAWLHSDSIFTKNVTKRIDNDI